MALRLIAGEGQGDGKPRLAVDGGALYRPPQPSWTKSQARQMGKTPSTMNDLITALALRDRLNSPPSASNKYMGQTTLPGVPPTPKEKK